MSMMFDLFGEKGAILGGEVSLACIWGPAVIGRLGQHQKLNVTLGLELQGKGCFC